MQAEAALRHNEATDEDPDRESEAGVGEGELPDRGVSDDSDDSGDVSNCRTKRAQPCQPPLGRVGTLEVVNND